jgi:2-polyprenyl-6-hydroxyphenyl methylase/3-demethylubiquinone-9 3-methyltransferase
MRLPTTALPFERTCKICGARAPLFGVTDFHKNCEEQRKPTLALSGYPIYYRRCLACEFLFTDFFDDWSQEEFIANIYNADYKKVDPDFEITRPLGNANFLLNLFGGKAESLSILDFGAGNGQFSAQLRSAGFSVADTYDPFMPPHDIRPGRRYDIVTCFETIEHSHDPNRTVDEIVSFLAEGGLIILSTLLQPPDFEKIGLAWWYAGPRNGHVSLHSKKSFAHLWASKGFQAFSLNENLHFVFRTFPEFAREILRVI